MKIVIVMFYGLLLEVLSHQQEKCRKEKQRAQFYIYNANVNLIIYPCIQTDTYVGDICEQYNYRETKINNSDIIEKCMNYYFAPGTYTRRGTNFYNQIDGTQKFLTLCELPARAKLINNTVETIGLRQYTDERFYYANHHYYVLWTSNVCRDLNFIYEGYFDVWRIDNRTDYIRNEHISLKLTENGNLCSSKIWNSDYDGIIVSTQRIKTSVSTNLPQTYQSTLPRHCDVTASTEAVPTNSLVNGSTTTVSKIHGLHNEASAEVQPKSDFGGTEELDKDAISTTQKINNLRASVQCLILVVILLVLWYAFSVIVNFFSLRTAGKMRTSKSRAYLMYCVSQSLTNRYLYLDEWVNEKNGQINLKSVPQQLYESVE